MQARASNFAILSPSLCSWPLKIDKHFLCMWRSEILNKLLRFGISAIENQNDLCDVGLFANQTR